MVHEKFYESNQLIELSRAVQRAQRQGLDLPGTSKIANDAKILVDTPVTKKRKTGKRKDVGNTGSSSEDFPDMTPEEELKAGSPPERSPDEEQQERFKELKELHPVQQEFFDKDFVDELAWYEAEIAINGAKACPEVLRDFQRMLKEGEARTARQRKKEKLLQEAVKIDFRACKPLA